MATEPAAARVTPHLRRDRQMALYRRALELAPAFRPARANLATVLHRQNKAVEALAELDLLLDDDPGNPGHANLKAAALGRIGEFEEAIQLYESVLEKAADQPKIWMSYGHVLKTVGRQADSIAAYRRAMNQPGASNVYAAMTWDMANALALAIEQAKSFETATINAAIRQVANPPGEQVSGFAAGKAAIAAGRKINYEGASSVLDFDEFGDVTPDFGVFFIENGQFNRRYVVKI